MRLPRSLLCFLSPRKWRSPPPPALPRVDSGRVRIFDTRRLRRGGRGVQGGAGRARTRGWRKGEGRGRGNGTSPGRLVAGGPRSCGGGGRGAAKAEWTKRSSALACVAADGRQSEGAPLLGDGREGAYRQRGKKRGQRRGVWDYAVKIACVFAKQTGREAARGSGRRGRPVVVRVTKERNVEDRYATKKGERARWREVVRVSGEAIKRRREGGVEEGAEFWRGSGRTRVPARWRKWSGAVDLAE